MENWFTLNCKKIFDMKVFKFGGASVKDVDAVRNVLSVLKRYPNEKLLVVISAMGKTTNALEAIVNAAINKSSDLNELISQLKKYHFDIMDALFASKQNEVYNEVNNLFVSLEWDAEDAHAEEFDKCYDQMVGIGELISTRIVEAYLSEQNINSKWLDVRDTIKTDNTYREAKVEWEQTQHLIKNFIENEITKGTDIIVTQGFLGCTSENFTTTLGREGSDYTAAIFAYSLGAESVTIWKDVPGVLNADPKWFDNTVLLEQISYQDAIELSYYGASVIHPKTLKPLQNKNIPLLVKSFIKPEAQGTIINDSTTSSKTPCFIFKVNQFLLSISSKDFSFIVEENLSEIFSLFSKYRIRINTMLNSALSFSVCVDTDDRRLNSLLDELKIKYKVLYNEGVELVTIRYYDQATIDRVCVDKKLLLEVKSRNTVQLVVKQV